MDGIGRVVYQQPRVTPVKRKDAKQGNQQQQQQQNRKRKDSNHLIDEYA